MDKVDKESKPTNDDLTCGKREDPNLDSSLLPIGLGGKIRERKGKREKGRDFREKSSNLSLSFPAIGPLNPGEPRSKVAPHGKGYAWALVLRSFDNSGR